MKTMTLKLKNDDDTARFLVNNPEVMSYAQKVPADLLIKAVYRDSSFLERIKQTREICLAAVQQDGNALQFVKEQTEEICLAAVQQNGYALQYVEEQTEEICLAAVLQQPEAIGFVKNKQLKAKLQVVLV